MAISFIVTNSGTINAVANGKAYTVPRDHKNYDGIKDAVINGDADALERLANVAKAIVSFSEGKIAVKDGVVYFEGKPLHNVVTERILSLSRDGFPFQPAARFLDNLMNNPSHHSVKELYSFLEHQGLPLTEDGCFLGYKAVNSAYMDKHSGQFDNSVGKVLSVPRNTVDDDWRNACSSGFHVGSLEYVRSFASEGDHIMIVKVNPADVVSVPPSEVTKLRTCKYEVVGEYDYALLKASVYMPDTLHSSDGKPVAPPSGMGGYAYQDDYEDEDEEEEEIEEEDEFDDEEDEDDDY